VSGKVRREGRTRGIRRRENVEERNNNKKTPIKERRNVIVPQQELEARNRGGGTVESVAEVHICLPRRRS